MSKSTKHQASTGVTFQETMSGYAHAGDDDPRAGARDGQRTNTRLSIHATVTVADVDRLRTDPQHQGAIAGTIDYTPFGTGIPATRGVFKLFSPSADPRMRYMVYELAFEHDGKPYYLAGKKHVRSDRAMDLWPDTTTLYTRIHQGTDATGPVVAAGVLTLGVRELARLVRSMQCLRDGAPVHDPAALGAFGSFFLGNLWDVYVRDGRLVHKWRLKQHWRNHKNGPIAKPEPEPWEDWCAATPRSARPADLGFTRHPMVPWFAPRVLIQSGARAFVSSTFGSYADKREVHAALDVTPPDLQSAQLESDFIHRYVDEQGAIRSGETGLWFDYAADTGDGFDSTYTVASLLAAEALTPAPPRNTEPDPARNIGTPLPRGRFLVLGGDQVYPTASRNAYKDRFVGPFTAALPGVEQDPPDVYAIPGNHDWYDGLTSFSNLFYQDRWIGGWRTRQKRSYYGIKLPKNWWLWCIDIQLESDIDRPQLEYFDRLAERLQPGDRVLLCTAQPTWVKQGHAGKDYRNLSYFVKNHIVEHGAIPSVMLSGDTHHYYRYDALNGARQRITAGGAGAYLAATHGKPDALELDEDDAKISYVARAKYPPERTSRRLRWGALAFPWKNPFFGLLLGTLFLATAWGLQSASASRAPNLMEELAQYGLADWNLVLVAFTEVLSHDPFGVLMVLVIFGSGFGFVETDRMAVRLAVGLIPAVGMLSIFGGLVWGLSSFWMNLVGGSAASLLDGALVAVGFSLTMLLLGGLLAGALVGGHIALSNFLFGLNNNLTFVSQRIPHYKNFLRLHISADGDLTVYPIGIRRVPRRWWFNRNARSGTRWFEPARGKIEAELIEAPIRVANELRPTAPDTVALEPEPPVVVKSTGGRD